VERDPHVGRTNYEATEATYKGATTNERAKIFDNDRVNIFDKGAARTQSVMISQEEKEEGYLGRISEFDDLYFGVLPMIGHFK